MPKANEAKKLVKSTKLTEGEKKKVKQENKAKANPEKAAAKKVKSDAKRERRYVDGFMRRHAHAGCVMETNTTLYHVTLRRLFHNYYQVSCRH